MRRWDKRETKALSTHPQVSCFSSTCKDLSVEEQNFTWRIVGKTGTDAEGELNMEMIPKQKEKQRDVTATTKCSEGRGCGLAPELGV